MLLAPYAPFITEMMYDNMKKCMQHQEDSIHFLQIPAAACQLDLQIENTVLYMQRIIEVARRMREQRNLSLKQPLTSLTVVSKSADLLS